MPQPDDRARSDLSARLAAAVQAMRSAPRRTLLVAAAAIAVVAVVATSLVVTGDDDRAGPADRRAFHEAIADLAAAKALRYSTSSFGGQVQVDHRVTATGQSIASMPTLQGLGLDLSMDVLLVDNKLFLRLNGDPTSAIPGLDTSDPRVRDAIESARGTLFGGHWITNVSEYDGPIVRDSMVPVGLALKLSDLLERAPDDRLVEADPIDSTPTLRAETPGGDIYITAHEPHRVLRFVPAESRDRPPGSEPTVPSLPSMPPLPSVPSIPAPPPVPRDGDPPPSIPDLPSVPELPEGLELPDDEYGAPTSLPHHAASDSSDRPVAFAQGPTTTLGDEQEPMPVLGGAVDHIDLEVLDRDATAELFDDLIDATSELDGALDGVLRFAEDELRTSLAAGLASGQALEDCGPESCRIEADATLIHARGNPVPTELTLAMTVGGRPAGQCTATGKIDLDGTSPLGCTNDSPEWRAAYRAGEPIDAEVVELRAMVFAADDLERVLSELRAYAAESTADDEAAPPTSRPRMPRFRSNTAANSQDADKPVTAPTVEAVLDELGIAPERWQERVDSASSSPRAIRAVHVDDVAALEEVVKSLVHPEGGTRPLDHIDRDSARRVIERALAATDRAQIVHAIETFRAALEILRRSDIGPGRSDSLAEGAKIFLDVTADEVTSGPFRVDLRQLGLDASRGRMLTILWPNREGVWHAAAVWRDAAAARNAPVQTVEQMELLGNFVAAGGQAVAWFRTENGIDDALEPIAEPDPIGTPEETTTPTTPPVQPSELAERAVPPPPTVLVSEVVPPAYVDQFSTQGYETYAGVFVNGKLVGEIRSSSSDTGDAQEPTDHAEQHLFDEGYVDAALTMARALAEQGQQVTVTVAINRTPCGGKTCSVTLEYVARQVQKMPNVRFDVAALGFYGAQGDTTKATPVDWIRRTHDLGGHVRTIVPKEGMKAGGKQLNRLVVADRARMAKGHSANSLAANNKVNVTVGAKDLAPEQSRTLQHAYDDAKRAGRTTPPSARSSVDGMRSHLRQELKRVPGGVPLDPKTCTCPPCVETKMPM